MAKPTVFWRVRLHMPDGSIRWATQGAFHKAEKTSNTRYMERDAALFFLRSWRKISDLEGKGYGGLTLPASMVPTKVDLIRVTVAPRTGFDSFLEEQLKKPSFKRLYKAEKKLIRIKTCLEDLLPLVDSISADETLHPDTRNELRSLSRELEHLVGIG